MNNVNINGRCNKEKEALKFLERDFNQCFGQMRHYDSQIIEICRFSFIAYSGLTGIALGLYKFGIEKQIDLRMPISTSIIIGLIIGLLMYALAIRNRVYFVQVARYINEQRDLFFKEKPMNFKNKSRMYTDCRQPPYFNWRSSQAWIFYIIAMLNGTLLSVILFISINKSYRFWLMLIGFIILLSLQLIIGIKYLESRENKSAEKAVFGREKRKGD